MKQYVNRLELTCAVVPGLLLLLAIWWPFGFSLGGLIEEWDLLEVFSKLGPIYIIDSNTALAAHRARPLTVLPQAIAFSLDSSSFFYWHILQATALLVKYCAGYFLGRFMLRSRAVGMLLGALILLFPADTMQLSLRVIHINWSYALILAAAAIALGSFIATDHRLSFIYAVTAALLLFAACLMYEAVAPLVIIPAVALYVRSGSVGFVKASLDRPLAPMLWLGSFTAATVFILNVSLQTSAYQAEVIGASSATGALEKVLRNLDAIIWTAGYRTFYESWKDIFLLMVPQISSLAYIMLCAAALFFAFYLVFAHDKDSDLRLKPQFGRLARLLIGGLLLALAGFAPYLMSQSHLVITQRTFLGSAIGSAFVVVFFYTLGFARFNRVAAAAGAAFITSICLLAQIYQFDRYNRMYAEVERPLIQVLATVASSYRPGEPVVVVNDYGYLSGTWDLGIEAKQVLGYLYPNLGAVTICEARTGRILPRSRVSKQAPTCTVENEHVKIKGEDGSESIFARFSFIHADGTITFHGDLQRAPVRPATLATSRLLGLGRWDAAESMFNKADPDVAYSCQFESMWGYALPCRGYGFHDVEAARLGPKSPSFAWIGETRAGLIIQNLASDSDYHLKIELHTWLTPNLNEVRLSLNGSPIQINGLGTKYLEGKLERKHIKEGLQFLEIEAPLDSRHGLSLAIEDVEIRRL